MTRSPAIWDYVDMLPATNETRELEQAYKTACDALLAVDGVGSGPMHLTPDAIRNTDEYRTARLARDRAFAALRAHNARRLKG